MARKTINTTVDEVTIAAIERLATGGRFASKGQVIDAGVAMLEEERPKYDFGDVVTRLDLMSGLLNGEVDKTDEMLELARSLPNAEDVQDALRTVVLELKGQKAGESRAVSAGNGGFNPASISGVQQGTSRVQCKHCGSWFTGARFATICGDCSGAGHSGEPRDCRGCTEGMSL